jgi:hypothetical protein
MCLGKSLSLRSHHKQITKCALLILGQEVPVMITKLYRINHAVSTTRQTVEVKQSH